MLRMGSLVHRELAEKRQLREMRHPKDVCAMRAYIQDWLAHCQLRRQVHATQSTGGAVDGKVACELTARTHGPSEWWVLVEKDGARAVDSTGGTGKGKAKAK